jgi:GTP-binding protein LepA
MAIENNLDIIPVINKIDLPAADVEKVSAEIMNLLGCSQDEIIPISAKTGMNVEAVLDAVIDRVRTPKVFEDITDLAVENQELKALVFDSQYDSYRGVVSYVKVFA